MTINSITAIKSGVERNEGPSYLSEDDPYIKVNGVRSSSDRIEEIRVGELSINKKFDIGNSGRVELLDYDGGGSFDINRLIRGSDDSLGAFSVNSATKGNVSTQISGGGSTYNVKYSVSA